ncbi:MAG: histidine--tRNA ligase [Candidatus Micrarchaeaceae archaeon]
MLSNPKGFDDKDPSDSIRYYEAIETVRKVYERFGFYPLYTPAVEYKDVLSAKVYGEENQKERFDIEGEDFSLRYDLTVPMARYVAMRKDIKLPFKRYQIAQVWRKEEPQLLRTREFTQADVDIVGSESTYAELECMFASLIALEELGIEEYKILINSRQIATSLLDSFGVEKSLQVQSLRIIDKASKIGESAAVEQMNALLKDAKKAEEIIDFIFRPEEEKLEKVSAKIGNPKDAEKVRWVIDKLNDLGINGEALFDPSLVRGLDYYTGIVWEFKYYKEKGPLPSIGGGGRYDNLIGTLSGRKIPAVGSSLGIDRILGLNRENGKKTLSKVFVAYIEGSEEYAYSIAKKMREAGINVDFALKSQSISKHLDYANWLGIDYVVIVGEKEEKEGKITLRDMKKGSEELLGINEAIELLG